MKTPERRRDPIPATKLKPEDSERIHRDRVRLLGEMAKLLDLEDEEELRLTLADLGQPEGSEAHEKIVRYWRDLLAENQARRKRQ